LKITDTAGLPSSYSASVSISTEWAASLAYGFGFVCCFGKVLFEFPNLEDKKWREIPHPRPGIL